MSSRVPFCDLLTVRNKPMSLMPMESSEFENTKPNVCKQLLLQGINFGGLIKFQKFLRHHKFPPGCKGHVSKFSIQSFYYPWYRVQCSQQKRFMTAYHEQPLFSRLQYVYKIINNINCPKQLTDYSVKWSQRNCRSLRDSTLLDLPQVKTKCE